MKIFETKSAPNPRLVRIFLAEKGVSVEYIQVDIEKGENLSAEFRAKSPTTKIPLLELEDGTCIGETGAICRYFEELYPDTLLMGSTPLEKAQIEMWRRRVEMYFIIPIMMCFQHTSGYFKDRMTPIAAWGEESGKNAIEFLSLLEEQLSTNTYIAGEEYSFADICLLVAVDFARVVKIRLNENYPNLQRWHKLVSERPSAKA